MKYNNIATLFILAAVTTVTTYTTQEPEKKKLLKQEVIVPLVNLPEIDVTNTTLCEHINCILQQAKKLHKDSDCSAWFKNNAYKLSTVIGGTADSWEKESTPRIIQLVELYKKRIQHDRGFVLGINCDRSGIRRLEYCYRHIKQDFKSKDLESLVRKRSNDLIREYNAYHARIACSLFTCFGCLLAPVDWYLQLNRIDQDAEDIQRIRK